jgi:hypothetical protein
MFKTRFNMSLSHFCSIRGSEQTNTQVGAVYTKQPTSHSSLLPEVVIKDQVTVGSASDRNEQTKKRKKKSHPTERQLIEYYAAARSRISRPCMSSVLNSRAIEEKLIFFFLYVSKLPFLQISEKIKLLYSLCSFSYIFQHSEHTFRYYRGTILEYSL